MSATFKIAPSAFYQKRIEIERTHRKEPLQRVFGDRTWQFSLRSGASNHIMEDAYLDERGIR